MTRLEMTAHRSEVFDFFLVSFDDYSMSMKEKKTFVDYRLKLTKQQQQDDVACMCGRSNGTNTCRCASHISFLLLNENEVKHQRRKDAKKNAEKKKLKEEGK